jgi:5-methylcytosine-specific restriction endonuclease McrA
MARKKCKACGDRYEKHPDHPPFRNWCSTDCALSIARVSQDRARAKQQAKAKREQQEKDKAFKRETKQRRDAIKGRAGKKGYYEDLKTVLHQYIKHVLRKGEPCYTCGKPQKHGDNGGAFHVGHFIPAKASDPRRFVPDNLRIQCYTCNTMNSGRRVEYRESLIKEMGQIHVDWLECIVNHKSLKEQYPDIDNIKEEIARYRQLLRDNGLKPNV